MNTRIYSCSNFEKYTYYHHNEDVKQFHNTKVNAPLASSSHLQPLESNDLFSVFID